jgi:hypothetical protein
MYKEINKCEELVRNNKIVEVVEKALGHAIITDEESRKTIKMSIH